MEETFTLNEVEYRDLPNHDVLITFLLSFGGFALGYDSLVLTGFIPILGKEYRISFQMVSLSLGIFAVGAFLACIVAPLLNDRYGRKRVILVSCGIAVFGDLILATAFAKSTIIIARFITGLSIGLTSSTVPMYIVECAIPERRGCLATAFQFAIAVGCFVCSIISFCLYNMKYGFRLLVILNVIPVSIFASSVICLPESPRLLALKKRDDEARFILQRIHGTEDGIDEIISQVQEVPEDSSSCVLFRILRFRSTRHALLLAAVANAMQPLCGIEALIVFAPTLFMLGGSSLVSALRSWMVIMGVLAFSSITPFFYIEKIGRRNLLITSLFGASVSQLIAGGGLRLANIYALRTVGVYEPPPGQPKSHCTNYGSCFLCVNDKACGFCFKRAPATLYSFRHDVHGTNGSCLPLQSRRDMRASAFGPCRFFPPQKTSAFEWLTTTCPFNKLAMNLGLAGSAFFLLSYAVGTGAVPWIISAETFPTWARSTGVAASVAMRWAITAIIAISYFDITTIIPRYVSWVVFAVCSALGAMLFCRLLPESKERELEYFVR